MTDKLDKLTKACVALVQSQPFFGSLLLRMKRVATERYPTMATDGRTIFYNPAFVDKMPPLKLQGALAHEVLHVANAHHLRRGTRDKRRFNVAADFAINPIVIKAGFDLPDGALNDPAYDGQGAERIYAQLPPSPPESEGGSGDGDGEGDDPGSCGAVLDDPLVDDNGEAISEAQAMADIQVAVAQAANAAKAAGKLPAFLEEVAEGIKRGRLDWRNELRRFCQQVANDDYSWQRPNRRHLSRGIIMPSLRGTKMGTMVVANDTSGSMTAVYDACLAEIAAIADDMRPTEMHVVWCDTHIQKAEMFTPEDHPVTLNRITGGGTAFSPVFQWIEEQGIDPACVIYLTDLYGDQPAAPDYPVLWASVTKDATGPFGETLYIGEGD